MVLCRCMPEQPIKLCLYIKSTWHLKYYFWALQVKNHLNRECCWWLSQTCHEAGLRHHSFILKPQSTWQDRRSCAVLRCLFSLPCSRSHFLLWNPAFKSGLNRARPIYQPLLAYCRYAVSVERSNKKLQCRNAKLGLRLFRNSVSITYTVDSLPTIVFLPSFFFPF